MAAALSKAFAEAFGFVNATAWFSQSADSINEATSPPLETAFSNSSVGTESSLDANDEPSCTCPSTIDTGGAIVGDGMHGRKNRNLKPSASEMARIFEMFDGDRDGVICAKDLRDYMSRIGFELSEREADVLHKSGDHNGDGMIDLEEFFSVYSSLCHEDETLPSSQTGLENEDDEDSMMLAAFQVFDKNDDGLISAEELQMVLRDMGMAEGRSLQNCKKMINAVDCDANGEIDVTEFKALLSSNRFQIV